ncbi:MAG TPA: hypothetical protein DEF16_01990 [Gemmobacter sp.]|nr:hypothetical protein [Gemmobacter sp.]HBU13751.1 hypothetical protein [Gemmobacter sp.]
MSYGVTLQKHRRLAILRFLKDCDGYTANGSIIRDVVNGVGVASTADQITTELSWLKEQGLIALEDLGSLLLATATARGVEIAQGLANHPGIQRPSPRP